MEILSCDYSEDGMTHTYQASDSWEAVVDEDKGDIEIRQNGNIRDVLPLDILEHEAEFGEPIQEALADAEVSSEIAELLILIAGEEGR